MKKFIFSTVLGLATAAANASPINVMIGDADGFGGAFTTLNFPQDHRSVAEAAATDGSQQTDYYTALFSPQPESFTISLSFDGPVTSLSLSYRAFGLQSSTFGPISALINGVSVGALFNFEDSAFGDAVHGGSIGSAALQAINGAGNTMTMTLSRNGSIDALAFDYFSFVGETSTASVPEPTSLTLAGLALLGLVGASRRRRSA